MKDRKRINLLKNTLTGKRQEVKYLRKKIRISTVAYKAVIDDYHSSVDELKEALIEARRKKWYQFKQIKS